MRDVYLSKESENQNKGINEIGYHSIIPAEKKWIPLCKRKKINTLWIFAICANQIAMCFIWIPLGVFTNPYCKKLNLSHIGTTFVFLISCLSGLIFPPFVAAFSDSTTLKFGRRRIYLIFGEIFVMIGLLLIGFCRELSSKFNTKSTQSINTDQSSQITLNYNNNAAIFYFVTGMILAYFGGNVANGPGRAMCSDVVPASQQVLVSSICVLDSAIAGIISNTIGALKLYQYTPLNNETLVLVCSSVIGLAALTVSVISTPEEQMLERPRTVNPVILILESFSAMNKNLLFVLLAFFFHCIGAVQIVFQASNYIAKIIFGGVPNAPDGIYDAGVSHSQFLSLFQTFIQLIYSFLNTKVVDMIGLKETWIFGMICLFLADVLFYTITNKYLLAIPYILNGIAVVIANSAPYAYVSLVTPPEKLAGSISLIILFGNCGSVFAILVLSMYLGSFKYFEDNPGRLICFSSIFAIVAMVCGEIGYRNVYGQNIQNEFKIANSSDDDDN